MKLLAILVLCLLLAGCSGAGNGPAKAPGGGNGGGKGGDLPLDGQGNATLPGAGGVGGAGAASNATSGAPRAWASLADAAIRPGVQVVSGTGQCTSNFIFTSLDNATVYLGVAAHCVNASSDATGTATNGCDRRNTPSEVGAEVEVEGAQGPGVLAYTSWGTMQATNETDAAACDSNDFALIRLEAADAERANPAMLKYGGPTAVADPGAVSTFDKVLTFGNSGLRFGVDALREKEGYVVSSSEWTTRIYTAPPGVEGDSGSAVILADGSALGVLVTSELAPFAAASGISNLAPALAYAKERAGLEVRLATWDVLDDGLLPPL